MVRLAMAVIGGLAEEAVLVAVVLILLPRFGVRIPVWWLAGLMAVLAINNAVFFLIGRRALKKRPLAGLTTMAGTRGEVVRKLSPRGLVKIRGELWQATSEGEEVAVGESVTVVKQDGLALIVTPSDSEAVNP
ncbi:MAG: NfeD family protein [Chloroflexota bacterium]